VSTERGPTPIPGLRHSLRARVALGVAFPLMLALTSLSIAHYWRGRGLVEGQVRMTASQLGQVLTGSLRRAMLANDDQMINAVLQDVGDMETIDRVRIVDRQGVVRLDSRSTDFGRQELTDRPGCIECHVYAPATRPRAVLLTSAVGILRIATPINNEPACFTCHAETNKHLGVVLADVPVQALEQDLIHGLELDLAISVGLTVLVTIGVYLLVHRSVVRRVESFLPALAAFAGGDLGARLPDRGRGQDELDQLAVAFNNMADDLESHIRQQATRAKLRQRAIVEERERIARELHDGIAQLLGFVNNKAMAVRLLLTKDRADEADIQLQQLEEASRELFVDVREAIIGLRTTDKAGVGLSGVVEDYTQQFSRLSGIPVELSIGPEVKEADLNAEGELQLLRIIQEALTNVRKHADASRASVSLQTSRAGLELAITDNGIGFQPADPGADQPPQFGLSTMRERAESIGATFELSSMPGAGTRIAVHAPLKRK
jgi:signal transduction histidine kinase